MNDKKKKPQKLKARLPRGFVDRSAADIRAVDEMTAKIREVYERYGFDPVETPLFEYTDALGKFLPDSDRPNEGVFSLQDDDEQWMSARYDLTAPLARHVAENFNEIQLPYRTYRAGYVFRNEKPGPGRFRQFMQFDADTVGAAGVQADAEMCMMMADTMEALGIQRGDYVIRVNNRKVLDGVLEAIGLGGDENVGRRLTVLRAIDKLDKFGVEGVKLLLGAGRKDESGDFTKGAGLNEDQIERVGRLFQYVNENDTQSIARQYENSEDFAFETVVGRLDSTSEQNIVEMEARSKIGRTNQIALGYITAALAPSEAEFNAGGQALAGLTELLQLAMIVGSCGYSDRVLIDPSCVRGLEYYTGPVFEAELQFAVTNEKGEKVVFGSVGGGGRYDGLVSRFMGQPVPATGFSIGVSRLMTALKNLGKLGMEEVVAPVVVCVMDRDTDSLGKYQQFTQALRHAGIRAEMYQGNKKNFGDQLKYADRRNSPIAIIQGGDERADGVVQIKDLIEGKRLSGEIEDNATWREARVAQVSVPEAELVAKVREMLAAQAEDRARAK
ncbi:MULTISPECIES: histidine--tRNA ligase [unclassified Rhizobium]|uniref:histidine--tRNA ligase n=1 Tax=unclassified Rhizobium TaxID=2613769 RepID=UPI0007123285|nr:MULTISPECIES: histidine--tRNA ligase [unclassified Rhizobium]KQS91168.1 histidine--tRNA ligase [Rhizobium sp. Leaf391]KQS96170.1 histidine--tRNA ligase [Rhizobium sp. Leaf386]KQU09755.1 histidine--tRNA ligase [Rhizobium sp. Leaf453]